MRRKPTVYFCAWAVGHRHVWCNCKVKEQKGHLVDALAHGGDEGRVRLRKVWGSCQKALIPKYPNGETLPFKGIVSWIHSDMRQTWGTETSHYPEERKSTDTPLVVASERGPGHWSFCIKQEYSGKFNRRGWKSRIGRLYRRPSSRTEHV